MRTKTKFARRIKIPLCLFACWDAIPNPCYHHDSVMVAHSCGVLKKRFAKTRSLHPSDAVQGFGISQQAFCNAKMAFVYTNALLAGTMPSMKQQFNLPEDIKIILGGYSLAGLFALWASTQTNLFYGIAVASPSVWFPGWMEFEQQHPIQAQHIYLSLGDKEEHTKNTIMAAVGDNIRALHSRLTERGADCTLEWNSGGHFKDADLRTAKAFRWVMEEHT